MFSVARLTADPGVANSYFLRSFSLPLIQEMQLSVPGENKNVHILVNHLED